MTRSKARKTIGYTKALPSALVVMMKMVGVFIDFKLSQRSSRKHFKRGLMEAGLTRSEAEKIAGGCFNGGDEEAQEEV